jgi:hypothetical protein
MTKPPTCAIAWTNERPLVSLVMTSIEKKYIHVP